MKNEQVREQIINYIMAGIQKGAFVAGDRLPSQRKLAEIFGVDKILIRDAMKILEDRGFVTIIRGSGAYVNSVSTVSAGDKQVKSYPIETPVSYINISQCVRIIMFESIRSMVIQNIEEDINAFNQMIRDYHQNLTVNTPVKDRYLYESSFTSSAVAYSHNPLFQKIIAELIDYQSSIIMLSCKDYDMHKKIVELDLVLTEALNNRDLERATWLIKERSYYRARKRSELLSKSSRSFMLSDTPLLVSYTGR